MNKHVVICDDDEGIVDIMRIVLEKSGYKVTVVDINQDIVKQIEHSKPNLILMDLWMPHQSGDITTLQIKTSEKTKHIPVIIISAVKNPEQIASAIHADDVICKPFDIQELEQKVAKYTS